VRWLALLLVPLVLAAGLWLLAGVVAPGYWWSIGLGVAWFVVASAVLARVGRRHEALRGPLRATFLACVAIVAVGFYLTSVRATEVDERIETGVPASELAPAPEPTVDPLAPQP